jgi:dihydrofolate reductase
VGKLIYSMGVSLDGFIAGPDGAIAVPAPDEELHRFHNQQARELGVHLCGRRLYEVMSYWDTFAEENPSAPEHVLEFAHIWEKTPKIVYSRTLEEVGPNARLVTEIDETEIARSKEEAGADLAVGGAGLAAAFMERGLIDVYEPFIHPVVAGGGTAFFPPEMRISLRLVETRTFGSGVVDLRYEPVADDG